MLGRLIASKGLGIGRVVFPALDIGFDILRWDEPHLMTEDRKRASQMMRPATGFDRDYRRRQLLEEGLHLLPSQLLAENGLLRSVDAMQLVDVL